MATGTCTVQGIAIAGVQPQVLSILIAQNSGVTHDTGAEYKFLMLKTSS